MIITIASSKPRQILDITDQIRAKITEGGSACLITALHTTCAITTADLDPGTDEDLLEFLQKITPAARWRHPHDPSHAPDHLLASVIGTSLVVPLQDGTLQLGAWQRIILVELAGPRERTLAVIKIG